MKIDVLCTDGSPIGITYEDIYGRNGRVGIGGAELALMTVLEGWSKNHEVTLYNTPLKPNQSPFEQRATSSFDKNSNRDVLIVFRSPNQKVMEANGYRVWWSTDQNTIGDFGSFSQFVDKIVTISPFHSEFFARTYNIKDAIDIDIPIRTWEYQNEVEKIPKRLIFTSVPDRGLAHIAEIFPRIKSKIPDASIIITSDYRLWGSADPINQKYIDMFRNMDGVVFLGAVERERLIKEQLKAQIHLYPCIYDELFCIAVAESQVAGTLPITTTKGALKTTNMGILIEGFFDQRARDAFVEKAIETMQSDDLPNLQNEVRERAIERFSLERILKTWDEKVFNDC